MTRMKYPIGIQSFETIISGDYCYVDKTADIFNLVSNDNTCFLSRPRRFGKSLLISTMEAFFKGRKELFKGLAIEKLENKWDNHPVIRLDFSSYTNYDKSSLISHICSLLSDYEFEYSLDEPQQIMPNERFRTLIKKIFEKTGKKVVILIDEYDKPIIDTIANPETMDINRNILKGFYSVLKTSSEYIRFAFLTGVTKFSQVSVFSGLNQIFDISMNTEYDTICGITEEELETYFHEDISLFAEKIGKTYEGTKDLLRTRYDGYHFSKNLNGVYNPFSLLYVFQTRELGNYWFQSGTPTYLIELLKCAKLEVNCIENVKLDADEFANYNANIEKPIPMMYQTGYLTIKGFDDSLNVYELGYPNREVRSAFLKLLAETYIPSEKKFLAMEYILDLNNGNVENFMSRFKSFVASINYQLFDKDYKEKYYQTIFYLLFRLMGADVDVEHCTSEGRLDAVVKTTEFIYIFEFKIDKSAKDALSQIKEKHYADPYHNDGRKIICIGANFTNKGHRLESWEIG